MKPMFLLPLWLICLTGPLPAQLPHPQLSSVFPPGGQRGTGFEVTVAGDALDGPATLLVSDPRIRTRPVTDESGDPVPHRFVVEIPGDIEPGIAEVWVHGRFGLSNSRLLAVGTRREFVDRQPATSLEEARPVSLGTTVHGRTADKARSHYRVFVLEDQRLVVHCMARELDSRIEPSLELLDAEGNVLRKDPRGRILDYRPEVSTPLFITVRDRLYRGGDAFHYRLGVHAGPHIDHVLPLSVIAGEQRELTVLGRNLSGARPTRLRIASGLPLERGVQARAIPAGRSGGLPGLRPLYPGHPLQAGLPLTALDLVDDPLPLRLGLGTIAGIVEAGLGGESTDPQLLDLPAAVTGLFHPAGDSDVYLFDAVEGDRHRIEVRSSRLGYPTSPLVEVEFLNEDGRADPVQTLNPSFDNLGEAAFPLHDWDCSGWFRAPGTGRYRLTISDRFNLGGDDADRLYELCIRPPRPDFRAFSVSQSTLYRNMNRSAVVEPLTLLPGQVLPMRIRLERIDDFRGPVRIVSGSGPQGVVVHPLTITGTDGVLLLEAVTSADEAGAGELELLAEAGIDGETVRHPVEHGQVIRAVGDYRYEPVITRLSPHRMTAISTHQPFPVRVVPEKTRWSTSVAGRVRIPVRVERHGEFKQKLDFKIHGSGPLSRHPGLSIEGDPGELVIDLSRHKLDPGTHRFHLFAQTTGKYRQHPEAGPRDVTLGVYSVPLEIDVLPAPFRIVVEDPVPLVPGRETRVPVRIERLFGFEGQIDVLVQPAEGVRADPSPRRNDRFDLVLLLAPEGAETGSVELKALGKYNQTGVETARILRIVRRDNP